MSLTTCEGCRLAYGEEEWSCLELALQLALDDVNDLLTVWPWPSNVVIEVRVCPCGRSLARRVRTIDRSW